MAQLILGVNDLFTVHPELAAEWHPTKNGVLTPQMVTHKSNKKVWWKCSEGHEWNVSITVRSTDNCRCPVCAGKVVLAGFNDLATTHPDLAAQWHPTKNGALTPKDIRFGRNKKDWWICSEGHEWEASCNNRSKGVGCPYCAGKRIIPGKTDLATTHPDLAKEWHPTKNGLLRPTDLSAGSGKAVWWICQHGHEWKVPPHDRITPLQGCPYCSGHRVWPGFNDIGTTNPALAAEWHPTKNGKLTPQDVSYGSGKKVWWLGKCGHEWKAAVGDRIIGHACPVCRKEKQTSFPEQAIFYYCRQISSALNRYCYDGQTEIDVYLPELHLGIEYDGYLHKRKKAQERDARKDALLARAGITLIRVIEVTDITGCVDKPGMIYYRYSASAKYLNETIQKLLRLYIKPNTPVDVDIERDRQKIYELYIESAKQNSLEAINPDVAAEWHPTKNGMLKPSQIQAGSGKKVWWLCSEGHEWQAVVGNRVKGVGCPYCSGRLVISGETDLATVNPELAAEWHPIKNKGLLPSEVAAGSTKKAWWLGSCGHEWQAIIYSRARGNGCPYCSGLLAIPGETDLATVNPDLAAQWHPTKNGDLTPRDVCPGSGKKVWWICEKGHEWKSVIYSRSKGNGCPICYGRKPKQYDIE